LVIHFTRHFGQPQFVILATPMSPCLLWIIDRKSLIPHQSVSASMTLSDPEIRDASSPIFRRITVSFQWLRATKFCTVTRVFLEGQASQRVHILPSQKEKKIWDVPPDTKFCMVIKLNWSDEMKIFTWSTTSIALAKMFVTRREFRFCRSGSNTFGR